ncbi:hypothetical protein H206_01893 [Candidatus Electrothrix aarhusensis]|uniref:Uncharacterized protein n=1 Tax=Candidatus Electrothrix aarhusensis TaxID=1859131 RepID=A0A444ITX2_9BACT|nr:hypothetical protein H206_01893 [Candidatus Electrothrix aarhusensis]
MNELIILTLSLVSAFAAFILIPKLLQRKGIHCMP